MDGVISQYQNLLSGYTESVTYCTTSGTSNMTQVAQYTSGQITTHIFCTGDVTGTVGNDAEIDCNGEYIIAECQGFNGNNNTHTVCKYQKPSLNGNDINYDYSMNYFINANVGSTSNNLIEDANTINSYCPGTGQNPTPYKCEFNGTN